MAHSVNGDREKEQTVYASAAHIVGTRRIHGVTTTSYEQFCPGDTRQLVTIRPPGEPWHIDAAVTTAKEAFPAWARLTPMDRARFVARTVELMREKAPQIAALMRLEAGKPIHEAQGEVTKGIQVLEWASGIGFRLGGITRSGEGGAVEIWTRRHPLGVVGLITPYNFPFAVPLWKIGPALVAGNTIVLKGSEHTSAMTTMIADLFTEAGLPPGVLNVIQGGREVVEPLVVHPDISAISFTGSNAVWYAIHRLMAAQRRNIIPCQAELGGNNALYVSDQADIPLAVAAVMVGKFGSAGQRCTATQRVIVQRAVWLAFRRQLEIALGKLEVGLSDDPNVKTMGPVIHDQHLQKLLRLATVLDHGDTSLWGGFDMQVPPGREHGYFMAPTVILNTSSVSPLWREEVFGPILVVRVVDSFDVAIRAVNDSEYGFSAAIFSENRRELQRFRDEAQVGMIHFNEGTPGGEPQCDFGGWKATGVGLREMGDEGVQFFTRSQTLFNSSATTGAKPAGR